METSLIENKSVSEFDEVLSIAIGYLNAPPLSGRPLLRLGIENEEGEIYRIVAVKDLLTFMYILKRFGDLRCTVETLQGKSHRDLRAIVKCHFFK